METSERRPRAALSDLITERDTEFELHQLVRLAQFLHADKVAVGHFGPPDQEAVRFYGAHELASPHGSVSSASTEPPYQRDEASPVPLHVRTPSGLTDAYNPCSLPTVYVEQIRKALDAADANAAPAEFIDLFNHRLLSLEYRGWEKSRFYVSYERSPDAERNRQTLSFWLHSLMGGGFSALASRLQVPDRFLLRYSGFFISGARPAQNLGSMLSDFFGIPADVQEFRGEWCSVASTDRARLDRDGTRLGEGTILGNKTWYQQASARIRLGPVEMTDFQAFLPGTRRFGDLVELVNHYTRGTFEDVEVELLLRAEDVPLCQLTRGTVPSRLGWLTWLGKRPAVETRSVVFRFTDREARLRYWVHGALLNMSKRLQRGNRRQLSWSEDVVLALITACRRTCFIRADVVSKVKKSVWKEIESLSKEREDRGSIEIGVKEGQLVVQLS